MSLDVLGETLAKLRRPGVIKALAGQLAIAIGSSLVASTVEEAEERCDQLHEELETLTARIEAGRAGIIALIEGGDFDVAVMKRSADLGYVHESKIGVAVDLPGDDLADECPDHADCERERTNRGDVVHRFPPPSRTPPNGAPDGQPDVPPRMAGGYLPGAGGLLTVDDIGGNVGPRKPVEDIQYNGNPLTNPIETERASADAD